MQDLGEEVIPASSVDRRLQKIAEEIRDLERERAWLQRMRRDAVRVEASNGAKRVAPSNGQLALPDLPPETPRRSPPGASTVKAIGWIRANPGHHYLSVVTALLDQGLGKAANDPRKSVLTTLSQLVKHDKLRRDDEDRLFPMEG